MKDDVRSEVEWTLKNRSGKSVVDQQLSPNLASDVANGLDVQDLQKRVRGRLDPNEFCGWPDRAPKRVQVLQVLDAAIDAPRGQEIAGEIADIDVDVVGEDDVRTRFQRLQHGRRRSHA